MRRKFARTPRPSDRETFKARMGDFIARMGTTKKGAHFADEEVDTKKADLIRLLPRRAATSITPKSDAPPANGTSGKG